MPNNKQNDPTPSIHIRPFNPADQAALDACDFSFTANRVLALRKTARGAAATWELYERALEGQYHGNYSLSEEEWQVAKDRSQDGPSLLVVAEYDGKPVALLDLSLWEWNEVVQIWNLYIDAAHRRHGLGRQLIAHAAEWGRAHKARALRVETQSNNYAACQFYKACGFELSGIDDHYYSNEDRDAKMGVGEVALFWYLPLIKPAKRVQDPPKD